MSVNQVTNRCVTYYVKATESIAEVTENFKGLPTGRCRIEIKSKENDKIIFDEWRRVTGTRIHINRNAQNIYSYFRNVCSDMRRLRTDVISEWMRVNKINEIEVTVCEF